jgi:hypothetical protein
MEAVTGHGAAARVRWEGFPGFFGDHYETLLRAMYLITGDRPPARSSRRVPVFDVRARHRVVADGTQLALVMPGTGRKHPPVCTPCPRTDRGFVSSCKADGGSLPGAVP